MNATDNVVDKLAESSVYQEYEKAFSEATGLPMSLRPLESWQLPLRGKRNENPFCCMMSQKCRSCASLPVRVHPALVHRRQLPGLWQILFIFCANCGEWCTAEIFPFGHQCFPPLSHEIL
jgi:hypothetical protein